MVIILLRKARAHSQKTLEQNPNPKGEVDISSLKRLVLEFPKDSPLRNTVLAERTILKSCEYTAKLETWLNLLRVI